MVLIRTATPVDAASLLEIYRPYVEATAVSFETEVPSAAVFAARIEQRRRLRGRWVGGGGAARCEDAIGWLVRRRLIAKWHPC